MQLRGLITVAAATTSLFAFAGASAQAAPINECGNWGWRGSSGPSWGMSPIDGAGIYNVTTRAVGCATARRFVRRYRGTDSYYPTWNCVERNAYESSDIRCTASGGRVIRWQSGS